MTPYNEKLWTVPLHELTCEWMGRFIPSTSLEQILDGALTDQSSNAGYNATFSYPLRGGIEALPQAFAASLANIHTGCELAQLDLQNRQLHFKNGRTAGFHRLVTTMPLPALLRAASDVPQPVREAAQKLRFTSVCNVNLGVNRNISDKHWIYFPEPEYCFYRIGFSHNFSPNQAPAGCSAIYAEVGYSDWKPLNRFGLVERIKMDLMKAGILKSSDRVLAELCLDIPCAYVIYDLQHRHSSELVRRFLRENGIFTIGRYGAWEYSGMEDAIWQGRQAAEEIMGLALPASVAASVFFGGSHVGITAFHSGSDNPLRNTGSCNGRSACTGAPGSYGRNPSRHPCTDGERAAGRRVEKAKGRHRQASSGCQ
jgi:protoporphyrinogen oxidase